MSQVNTAGYCLNTSTIRNCRLSLHEKIRITSKAGYQAIELWISEIDDYLKNGGKLAEINSIVKQNSIVVENIIAFFQWANPDKDHRTKALEEARSIFETARAIDCPYVAAPPAGITDMIDIPLENIAEYFRDLLQATQDTGVKPLLEFWGHSKTLGSLAQAIQVGKLVNDEVLFLADVFHMSKTEGSFDLLAELKGSQIGLFHVNDYPFAPDIRQLKDSQRVYPADGVAPLAKIYSTLKQIGYSGMFSLELFNEEYEKAGAENVAITGIEKMKRIFA